MQVVAFNSFEVTVSASNGRRYVYAMSPRARAKLEKLIERGAVGKAWQFARRFQLVWTYENQPGVLT